MNGDHSTEKYREPISFIPASYVTGVRSRRNLQFKLLSVPKTVLELFFLRESIIDNNLPCYYPSISGASPYSSELFFHKALTISYLRGTFRGIACLNRIPPNIWNRMC